MKKGLKIMVGGVVIILAIFCIINAKKEQERIARIHSVNTIEITGMELGTSVTIEKEVESQKDFEIRFYDKKQEGVEKIQTILDKTETQQYDYSIYAYDGNVNIRINKEEMSLRNALLQNKITMEEIIDKAKKDIPNAKLYKDGGSIEYHYDDYTIIKVNQLDGNKDIYIGTKNMTLNDLSI